MKILQLRPYPGFVMLFDDFEAYRRKHRQVLGKDFDVDRRSIWGRCVPIQSADCASWYLVYVQRRRLPTLVHELTHVLLMTFDHIGADPKEGNGEPFCYMLSTLVEEAQAK